MQIIIPSTIPIYNIASQTYTLVVNAKFTILDFPVGQGILYQSNPISSIGNFSVYGSFSNTSFSSCYFISYATTNITISEHRVPVIGHSTFNTKGFEYRKATVNQPCVFYMLIDPTT